MFRWSVALACILVAACAAPTVTPAASPTTAMTSAPPSPAATTDASATTEASVPMVTQQPEDSTPRPTRQPRPTPEEGTYLPLTIEEFGYTVFPVEAGNFANFAATFTNPNSEWAVYRMLVQVNLFDADDNFVGGPEVNVTALPGQTTAIAGQVYGATSATRMEIVIPDDPTPYLPFSESGDIEVSDVAFTSGDSTTNITGSLTSSLASDQAYLQLFAVYRDLSGAIIGGGVGAVESMPAGATVPFEIIDSPAPATTASVDVYWQIEGRLP